ncbi:MAG: hypothetical protein H3C35_06105 [Bacteroidetes bacterium]|nr:hypothetical protein [Bacteroidota bacterium]
MQNRYVGDIGDFGKYLLLKAFSNGKLKLGVNWYLTADEHHNSDGKFIEYLLLPKPNEYSSADDRLYKQLYEIVFKRRKRNVKEIEKNNVLKKEVQFFSEELQSKNRKEWFTKSIGVLKHADIIFCDPDNGIEVQSCSIEKPESVKYLYLQEMKKYYELGKSLIIYQHGIRKKKNIQFLERKAQLVKYLNISSENVRAVYSKRRFYFILMQKNHKQKMLAVLQQIKRHSFFQFF